MRAKRKGGDKKPNKEPFSGDYSYLDDFPYTSHRICSQPMLFFEKSCQRTILSMIAAQLEA